MRKIGAYLPPCKELPLDEKLRLFKEAGFEFICLGMSGILDESDGHLTVGLCEKYGLPIENVHLTGTKTTRIWYDTPEGDEIVERYCKEIALCASKGLKIGITHVTWGKTDGTPDLDPIVRERFKRIVDCAEKNDFILALENSVFDPQLRYVVDYLRSSPNVGFCYDTGHRYCFTPDSDWIGEYGDMLVAMHLDDNDGMHDLHLIPFDGIAPWDDVIRDLSKTELYKRNIVFEVKGKVHKELPGKSADEIRKLMSKVKIANDESLFRISDGLIEAYTDLDYSEYLHRVFEAGLKIAGRN